MVVDLENYNYYFYYLDNNDNICEGYIEAKNTIDDDFVVAFNDNSMEKFISSFLSKSYSRKSNNLIIYNLSYCKFVIKIIDNLIDNDKNEKTNDYNKEKKTENPQTRNLKNKWGSKYRKEIKVNNKINDKNLVNENEIIKCLIYYYHSDLELNELKKEELNTDIKYSKFFPINSEWISLFKEKCNYEKNKNIIKKRDINIDNYLDNKEYLKDINFKELENFKIFPLDNFEKINNINVHIHKNYELINPDAYNLLVKFFGTDTKCIKQLDVIKLDTKYILIKYDSKTFEIVKINKEKERYLIA